MPEQNDINAKILPTSNIFELKIKKNNDTKKYDLGKHFLIVDKFTYRDKDQPEKGAFPKEYFINKVNNPYKNPGTQVKIDEDIESLHRIPINKENFDDVMKQIDVQLELCVENFFSDISDSDKSDKLNFNFTFVNRDSFHPDSLLIQMIQKNGTIKYWICIRESLKKLKGYVSDKRYYDELNEVVKKSLSELRSEFSFLRQHINKNKEIAISPTSGKEIQEEKQDEKTHGDSQEEIISTENGQPIIEIDDRETQVEKQDEKTHGGSQEKIISTENEQPIIELDDRETQVEKQDEKTHGGSQEKIISTENGQPIIDSDDRETQIEKQDEKTYGDSEEKVINTDNGQPTIESDDVEIQDKFPIIFKILKSLDLRTKSGNEEKGDFYCKTTEQNSNDFFSFKQFELSMNSMYPVLKDQYTPIQENNIEEESKEKAIQVIYAFQEIFNSKHSEKQQLEVDHELIDLVINDIDYKLDKQVKEIYTNHEFIQLESTWRALDFVVNRTDFKKNIIIDILNCSKDKLYGDFKNAIKRSSIHDSGLYKQVYFNEFDTPGGIPFSSIIINHKVTRSNEDLKLIEYTSNVAAHSHCPTFFPVGIEFFSHSKEELFKKNEFTFLSDKNSPYFKPNWMKLREKKETKYIGLTFNDFVLREPYRKEESEYITGVALPAVQFFNCKNNKISDRLSGSSAMAMLANITKSAADDGWLANVTGQTDGSIDGLPKVSFSDRGPMTDLSTEYSFSETLATSLSNEGIISFIPIKHSDKIYVPLANSINIPEDPKNPSSLLSIEVPNILFVSRVTHYLKAILRELQGTRVTINYVQEQLDKWLQTLKTVKKDDMETLKKRPLNEYTLVLHETNRPGYYKAELSLTLHDTFKGMSMEIYLIPIED